MQQIGSIQFLSFLGGIERHPSMHEALVLHGGNQILTGEPCLQSIVDDRLLAERILEEREEFRFLFWRTYCLSAPALYPAESLFTSTLFNIYSPSGTILLEEQDAMSSGKASNEIFCIFKISIVFDMQR